MHHFGRLGRPNKSSTVLTVVAACLLFLTACTTGVAEDVQYWVDVHTKDQMGQQMKQYVDTQPVPYYEYSAQRDALIQIYNATVPELRPAWHVFYTPGIGPTDSCSGVGAPLPFGVQLTAPEYKSDTVTLPLADPPGYYMSGETTATWVLCDFGHGLEPVYVEDMVRTYFHPVKVEDGKLIHIDEKPSVTISAKGS